MPKELWASIGVDLEESRAWPEVPMQQTYRGSTVLLHPETTQWAASIHARTESVKTIYETWTYLRRFLSAATWASRCGFGELYAMGSSQPSDFDREGPAPYFPPGRRRASPLWAPELSDRRALLALALYREGRAMRRRSAQSYLSFFKVLEILAKGKSQITALVEKHLDDARRLAVQDMDKHEWQEQSDSALAITLYEQGRCAIAHAHSDPIIDPDDSLQLRDIAIHVPLVLTVAELVIEKELGVLREPPLDWNPEWSLV